MFNSLLRREVRKGVPLIGLDLLSSSLRIILFQRLAPPPIGRYMSFPGDGIPAIFPVAHGAEIVQIIIGPVAVDMIDFKSLRDGSIKCFIHDRRHPIMLHLPILVKTDTLISIINSLRLQNLLFDYMFLPPAISYYPVEAPYLPFVANLVLPFISFDVFPLNFICSSHTNYYFQ